jgi:hypothetical protein
VGLGQVLSEYFGFHFQFLNHLILRNHLLVLCGAGTMGPVVAGVQSGLIVARSHELGWKLRTELKGSEDNTVKNVWI